jgi:hypothetical protein
MDSKTSGTIGCNSPIDLFLIDFEWQISKIEEQLTDKLVFSFNPAVQFQLERRGIRFISFQEIYEHQELWNQYPSTNQITLQLCQKLDKLLWKYDKRFAVDQVPVFDYLSYILKTNIDQLFFYTFILEKIFSFYRISKVYCLNSDVRCDDMTHYSSKISLLGGIIESFKGKYGYEIIFMDDVQEEVVATKREKSSFSFGQPKLFELGNIRLRKMYMFCRSIIVRFRLQNVLFLLLSLVETLTHPFSSEKQEIVSVSCKDINSLKKQFKKEGIRVRNFFHMSASFLSDHGNKNIDLFLKDVGNDKDILQLLTINGCNIFPIIKEQVALLFNSIDGLYEIYSKVKKFLKTDKASLVVLQTLAPFYTPNIFFHKVCLDKGIPLVCWMHGGYGAYNSLPGYDFTDYRLSQNHFVYGKVIEDLINSQDCILRKTSPEMAYKTLSVGAPFFINKYQNYKRPVNKRKRILLVIGGLYAYNRFYFGSNEHYSETCHFYQHRNILGLLVKYQEDYDIILKDYAEGNMVSTWKDLLKDLRGNKVKVITNEMSFKEVVINTDLHIFTWVSTTFMESLFTDADMFLLDKNDVTQEAMKIFEDEIYFNSDTPTFLTTLDDYLAKGVFYTHDKHKLRELFLTENDPNAIAAKITESIAGNFWRSNEA